MLTWEEAEKALKNVLTYLNTLDLKPYLKDFKHKRVWDMMNQLEKDFPYKDQYSETLFDAVSEDEFVDYLNQKYETGIRTVCTYYI